jgi:hypothetical protein
MKRANAVLPDRIIRGEYLPLAETAKDLKWIEYAGLR